MAFRSITGVAFTPHLRFLVVGAIAIYILARLFNATNWTTFHNSIEFNSNSPEYSSNSLEYRSNSLEYRFSNPSAQPVPGKQTVLVLTLIRNHESWGQGRSFSDFMKIVQGFDYPMSNINLGVLASDKLEFTAIANYIKQIPGNKKNFFPQIHDEDSVLWIDSDMIRVPNDLLHRMIDSGKDIITTATRIGPDGHFIDFNAWVGERIKPNGDEQAVIEQGGIFVPRPLSVKYTHQLEEEFGQLDSVGGTVLFVRGEVHREGAAFTTNYVIGAGWKHEGYDGIESEGLCYVAGFLGYKCWGMPHAIAEHIQD
ncbi:hypothetical protein BGZ74_000185 [Mortierella antarctica]|nr:hypothetical protein BGZ74_000185 [Mortierella antarctica]